MAKEEWFAGSHDGDCGSIYLPRTESQERRDKERVILCFMRVSLGKN